MHLSSALANEFDPTVRARGLSYAPRVRIETGNEQVVQAWVQGTYEYAVQLKREGTTVAVHCDCAFFDDRGPCKHLWATVIVCDSAGYLTHPGEPPARLSVREFPRIETSPIELDEPAQPMSSQPVWRRQLALVEQEPVVPGLEPWPPSRQLVYVFDVDASRLQETLVLELCVRERKQSGEWGKPQSRTLSRASIAHLPDPLDRRILGLLVGARAFRGFYGTDTIAPQLLLGHAGDALAELIAGSGRCFLRAPMPGAELLQLRWDEGGPYQLALRVVAVEDAHELRGLLRRGSEEVALTDPLLFSPGGVVFFRDRVAKLDDGGAFQWITLLRDAGSVSVPAGQEGDLLQVLHGLPRLPPLDLPEHLRVEEVRVAPSPRLTVRAVSRGYQQRLQLQLAFDYAGTIVAHEEKSQALYQGAPRRLVRRDPDAERAAVEVLRGLGARRDPYAPAPHLALPASRLSQVVQAVLAAGWHVEAEGRIYRRPGAVSVEVKSSVDWFDLHGTVAFGEHVAALPELLAAVRRGENMVRLDDGSFGMVPEEWLRRFGVLAELGTTEGGELRFRKSQAGLLDVLLAGQPEARWDAGFAKARAELQSFERVVPLAPAKGFIGELRSYQREGLGWFAFLRQFGFGGCLADDMGLGKTVQVLALLEARRTRKLQRGEKRAPSLVVMPRSLVFNWKQEAERFTPELRILDHTGTARTKDAAVLAEHHVVLTTYGTLRRDVELLRGIAFDYVILDESQAIKNERSEAAKAARLLTGTHRLALSGTPIENHLGELWSLFEFLNPGLLGVSSVFERRRGGERETRELLARALRPFILRRTKDQVAKDLPAKTELTLYCDLDERQRGLYDELREHYRASLLGRIEREGLGKAKIHILEALLRLRQAACHPGLLDPERVTQSSAKFDVLLPRIAEVLDEGHKALVFSQFTSLLAIVRAHLDEAGHTYEYLDGSTHDRAARVERFQTDPECKLFLISLKAGGLGLNLTAAEYVFLLDPWWNPAVEAQAIDRAHRIGQQRPVFAYRLIARGTVEEKILELQGNKRALADAIIGGGDSVLRGLKREDLELLLS